jgi:hypothetical protein
MRESYKRIRSVTPDLPVVKHLRVKKTGTVKERFPIDENSTKQEDSILQEMPATQNAIPKRSFPSWVDDMDPDLIEGLKGFVDFIE